MFYTQLVDTTLGAFENREYEPHLLQARLRLASPRATRQSPHVALSLVAVPPWLDGS